jgi:alkylation response protein AidB-like acyl-CoA dehydrogenase
MSRVNISSPGMRFDLTEAQRDLLELCHRLGAEALEPGAEERDRNHIYPREPMKTLARAGLNSLTVPEEYGGLGLGYFEFALVAEALAHYDPATAMVYVMHLSAVETVNLAGDDEQKRRLLPAVRERGMIATLAFSEPGTGGHFWYCLSQARRDGDGYILNKDSSWATSAGEADWYIVETRTPDTDDASDMLYLIVFNDQEGITPGFFQGMGMNANCSGPITWRDVRVRRENRLGEEGAAAHWNDEAIDPLFLIGSSAVWIGVAQAALNNAIHTAKTRVHKDFNKSVADYQVIRHYLARAQIHTDSARAMLYHIAGQADAYRAQGRPRAELLFDLWETKAHAADICIEVTNTALQVQGGLGYKRGKTERLLRDGRAGAVMGPSNEMCQEWIGRTLVGMDLGYWKQSEELPKKG